MNQANAPQPGGWWRAIINRDGPAGPIRIFSGARYRGLCMDELRSNKVFAGFLCAGLLIMAGVQIANVLVPDQQLAENSYVIEVLEATEVADAAPQDKGPEPNDKSPEV